MEIITKAKGGSIDEMAEKVFMESIRILGGLKKLVEYRNLTWLPSLAEAAYVVVLKNEAIKTYGEIAEILGITEQTAKNIATADEEKVKKYLMGGEKPNEHVAGGIAKLAYKTLKQKGELEKIEIKEEEMKALGIDWAIHVLVAIKGMNFPVQRETLKEKLHGIKIMGKDAKEIIEEIEYPVKSPAELLHKIKERLHD